MLIVDLCILSYSSRQCDILSTRGSKDIRKAEYRHENKFFGIVSVCPENIWNGDNRVAGDKGDGLCFLLVDVRTVFDDDVVVQANNTSSAGDKVIDHVG